MPILLDHQLREHIPHNVTEFPVTYYQDELAGLPHRAGPCHWHPEFELATVAAGVLDYQVGQQHITLEAGDSIFVNGNVLHRIRQVSGEQPDPLPIIVFSGAAVASETSTIYKKYIAPVARCDFLPFVVFRHQEPAHGETRALIHEACRLLQEKPPCYEMAVQRRLSRIMENLFLRMDSFPRAEAARVQIKNQIRLQKMLAYIQEHYGETVTLAQIAAAANISRSEAGRCFNTCMGCSPMEALVSYRLQIAYRLLREKTLTLQEISDACGFHSVNYFSRKFKQTYGYAPGRGKKMGK